MSSCCNEETGSRHALMFAGSGLFSQAAEFESPVGFFQHKGETERFLWTPKVVAPKMTPEVAAPQMTSKMAAPEMTPKAAVPELTLDVVGPGMALDVASPV